MVFNQEVSLKDNEFVRKVAIQNPSLFLAINRGADISSWAPPASCGSSACVHGDAANEGAVGDAWKIDALLFFKQNRKVDGIKLIRQRTGLGLKESKDIADRVCSAGHPVINWDGHEVRLPRANLALALDILNSQGPYKQ